MEGVLAEEDSGHDTGAKVTSGIRCDGYVGETPDHVAEGETNDKWRSARRDERIGGVENGPDDKRLY